MSVLKGKRLWLVGVLLTLLLVAVGCAAPAAAPTGDAAADAGGDEAMAEETTLVIAQTVDLDGLEPSEVNSRAESNVFAQMYATRL